MRDAPRDRPVMLRFTGFAPDEFEVFRVGRLVVM